MSINLTIDQKNKVCDMLTKFKHEHTNIDSTTSFITTVLWGVFLFTYTPWFMFYLPYMLHNLGYTDFAIIYFIYIILLAGDGLLNNYGVYNHINKNNIIRLVIYTIMYITSKYIIYVLFVNEYYLSALVQLFSNYLASAREWDYYYEYNQLLDLIEN
jgi:hypothetical protein